ncbi:plasmid partition protein ParG [Marinospirillum sp. MEB164]|uniref:Plasmid partition protein ParG n=1 Tax=Marinospirillum alkalitolerans TaxID=3123374 RepID=A0ABW8PZV6_9GAMM
MSGKKVAFGAKPKQTPTADDWVEKRETPEDENKPKMKRLTIDVPEDLHRQIKAECAMRGSKIADEVRELLLQKYGKA